MIKASIILGIALLISEIWEAVMIHREVGKLGDILRLELDEKLLVNQARDTERYYDLQDRVERLEYSKLKSEESCNTNLDFPNSNK